MTKLPLGDEFPSHTKILKVSSLIREGFQDVLHMANTKFTMLSLIYTGWHHILHIDASALKRTRSDSVSEEYCIPVARAANDVMFAVEVPKLRVIHQK